ncbi:4a-hydroxytetrahydrobiopterin dehydratase [Sediminivirga luteola]|uniref:Putative pterin-4-alpha-carbinolamine dehydratase n=1 Tax=Sediminivirga luteola TaxID=1774748 RepID=A0A8J2XJR7_9MICO|nr:4a-hydroxytetrahydrobiopterin dehydratase [Sediminivirga luteola]GGA08019.1 4a-hydroxytetrahydrobiopterin dehydratase [Sediminivirga luteola]
MTGDAHEADETAPTSREDLDAAGLHDWAVQAGMLRTRLATGDFATGLRLVNRIGAAAEAAGHHPDVDLRYPHVDIGLISHDAGKLTARDTSLAREVSAIAAEEGIGAAPPED